MIVYLSTTLNTGHAYGLARETIILPVLARDEEPQATTQESMFNLVRLSDGGPRRHPGPKSEVEVIAAIANSVTGWRDRCSGRVLKQPRELEIPGLACDAQHGPHSRGHLCHCPRL